MARERISAHPHKYTRLHLFTDSQFSLGIITSGWRSRTHPALAMKLKLLVRNFPIPVTVAWVPAHCGIDSNEFADELADRGGLASAPRMAKTWTCPPTSPQPTSFRGSKRGCLQPSSAQDVRTRGRCQFLQCCHAHEHRLAS